MYSIIPFKGHICVIQRLLSFLLRYEYHEEYLEKFRFPLIIQCRHHNSNEEKLQNH